MFVFQRNQPGQPQLFEFDNHHQLVRTIGEEVIGPGLRDLAARHPWIGEVRGTGVFWAVELVRDRATREPLAPYGGSSAEMSALLACCREEGLLPFANFNRVHVVPPLTTSAADARTGLEMLDRALTRAALSADR